MCTFFQGTYTKDSSYNKFWPSIADHDTIVLRQDVVAELIEKSEVFYNLEAVISRFLDTDHLLSLCVQVNIYFSFSLLWT